MSIDPRELVKGVSKLASLPEVCVRVNEMVDDPRCSAADIGKVISRDTSLTAQLLRIANSAFFNFPSRIETVSRAITVIGERELRYLVLALSAMRTFAKVPVELVNMGSFWRHSVYCGVVARLVAGRCHVLHRERLFVAGLLHDVGLLVILHRIPDLGRLSLQRARDTNEQQSEAEHEVIGCDHAQVGGELMRLWRMPASLQESVAFHHAVGQAKDARLEAAIVHVADVIAHRAEMGVDPKGGEPQVDPLALEITGITEEDFTPLMVEAGPMFTESWALIQPAVCEA